MGKGVKVAQVINDVTVSSIHFAKNVIKFPILVVHLAGRAKKV